MRFKEFQNIVKVALLATCTYMAVPAHAENWMAQIGGSGPEVVFDLVETSDQRLCATGTFTNEALFGAGDQQIILQADAVQDVYLACYSEDGRLDTALQFGGDISDQPRAIAALPGGDILITGYFLNRLGPNKSNSLQASGGADIFLIRVNSAGEEVWSRKFGGSFADLGNSLAIAANGDILLAGNFQEKISYTSGGETREIASAGGRDAFVFRLDSDGNMKWAQSFGGKGRDEASRVAAGPDGSVYVAGTFEDVASVGQGAGQMTSAQGTDGFLLAFDAGGELRWNRQLAGTSREYVSGLVIDSDGALYLSGNFLEVLSLPDGSILTSAGAADAFVVKFDATGQQVWAQKIGGAEVDQSFDLALSQDQKLLLSGHFQGQMRIPVDGKDVLLRSHGAGNPDGFIVGMDLAGKYLQAMTASGDGVETVFAVTALQGGGIATAGFFNKEVTMHIDGLNKLQKRGQTDVFLVRVARGEFRTAAESAIHISLQPGPLSAR